MCVCARLQADDMHASMECCAWCHFYCLAELCRGPEVQIMAGRSDMPETVRELLVSQLLSQTGCVPTFFERQVFPDATFMMTEHVGSRTLQALVQERSLRANGGPAVPLKQALPLMIDLLRGLQSMEHLSIVHGDLTEGNVYLVDGDRRAVITSFQHACLKECVHMNSVQNLNGRETSMCLSCASLGKSGVLVGGRRLCSLRGRGGGAVGVLNVCSRRRLFGCPEELLDSLDQGLGVSQSRRKHDINGA